MNNNAVPAQSYYGTPLTGYRLAAVAGSRIAAPSGPYIGRGDKCSGNDDTCGANKVRGQQFCAGHLKKIKSEQEA
ncbi:hypothetical protein UFOVP1549_18 [uncultured Caudovirales phage]|uniref:Uncharacterized protein n=1 Tax=uncultured Caudovirales phage TaxID=2100421 RepID=A0A6J7XF66_9CAUD|nr:hypothetical protein UFOVP303_15 [uncultured Caudovirales phage]CAB5228502.1 hypothetical protein UFOVP1549_18 [uncultured Caudovirales phage]